MRTFLILTLFFLCASAPLREAHSTNAPNILKTDVAKNKDDNPFYHRVTWTDNEDGSVRQYWEVVTNEKDISVAFDGLYKKSE